MYRNVLFLIAVLHAFMGVAEAETGSALLEKNSDAQSEIVRFKAEYESLYYYQRKPSESPEAYRSAVRNACRDLAGRIDGRLKASRTSPDSLPALQKLRALAKILAVENGDTELEPDAILAGMRFRNNKSNSQEDRFDMALRMRFLTIKRETKSQSTEAMLDPEEEFADLLVAEFPQEKRAYDIYVALARQAKGERAHALLRKVLLAPAPEETKKDALFVKERLELIGKPVSLDFDSQPVASSSRMSIADGANLETPLPGPTLVYVWTYTSDSVLEIAKSISSSGSKYSSILGVNIDTEVDEARKFAVDKKLPGKQVFDKRGLRSPIPLKLRVTDVPSVYVLSSDGVILAILGPSDVGNLASTAN